MVQLLASVLDVPLGERNTLLLGAGYAPAYGERKLDASELAHVRRALSFVLRQQEPFPAIVVDGGWNIVMRNEAAGRLFGLSSRANRQLGRVRRAADPARCTGRPPAGTRRRRACVTSSWPIPACRPGGRSRTRDVTLEHLRIECFVRRACLTCRGLTCPDGR